MGISQPSASEAYTTESLPESWIWEDRGGQSKTRHSQATTKMIRFYHHSTLSPFKPYPN